MNDQAEPEFPHSPLEQGESGEVPGAPPENPALPVEAGSPFIPPGDSGEQKPAAPLIHVPWTVRDVWLGLASLAVWFGVVIAIEILALKLKVDVGVFISLSEALLFVPVAILALGKYRSGWGALGLRGFKGHLVVVGCGLMVLFYAFNLVYSLILGLVHLREQVDLSPIIGKLSSPVWFWIGGALVAPLVEEIFFRGFVFGGLRGRYGFQKAALISSILFAAVHLQLTALIPIAILGYIFAFLYEHSGSIWPGILMHFLTNACSLSAAFYLASRG